MEENKKYVDNEVFTFSCVLKHDLQSIEITIYTKPFPDVIFRDEFDFMEEMNRQDKLVQEKYFTQEKIDELKLKLIQKIQECKNPFYITCIDRDSGYNVTENQLFKLD